MKRPAPTAVFRFCATTLLACIAATPALAADIAAGEMLAKQRNCMACHTVERKVVGPAFKAVAARYADRKDMVEPLAKKIRQGGAGAWGPVPMPANPQVSEADARALSAWILGLK